MEDYPKAFYDYILEVKKACAKKMRSKSHNDQVDKFIDSLWLEGYPKKDIIHGVKRAYGVTEGYAETSVNCFLNTLK